MPKISKNRPSKDVEDFIWSRLVEVFREAKNNVEVEEILDDLLTPSEKVILGKRLAISFLLEKGLTYVKISNLLKVSSVTIKSVKNSMRRRGKGYERLFIRLSRQSNVKFKAILEKFLDSHE